MQDYKCRPYMDESFTDLLDYLNFSNMLSVFLGCGMTVNHLMTAT